MEFVYTVRNFSGEIFKEIKKKSLKVYDLINAINDSINNEQFYAIYQNDIFIYCNLFELTKFENNTLDDSVDFNIIFINCEYCIINDFKILIDNINNIFNNNNDFVRCYNNSEIYYEMNCSVKEYMYHLEEIKSEPLNNIFICLFLLSYSNDIIESEIILENIPESIKTDNEFIQLYNLLC